MAALAPGAFVWRPELVPAGVFSDVRALTVGYMTEPLPRPGGVVAAIAVILIGQTLLLERWMPAHVSSDIEAASSVERTDRGQSAARFRQSCGGRPVEAGSDRALVDNPFDASVHVPADLTGLEA